MNQRFGTIVGALLIAGAAWAGDAPPQGTFEGTGNWRGADGSTGEYTSRLTIGDGTMVSEFEYPVQGQGSKNERHVVHLRMAGSGFFDLLDDQRQVVGRLSCLGDRCAYQVSHGGVQVQETMRLVGSELQKFGTKHVGSHRIVWTETLYAR